MALWDRGRPARLEGEANARLVAAAIREAAERGERCPSNDRLCGLLGFTSIHGVRTVLTRAEAMGLLVVETHGTRGRRIARAPDGSWATARGNG